jgi:hypothetical protein
VTTHTETGDCPACAPLYAAIDADGGGGGSPYERVENLHERALASQRAARAEPGLRDRLNVALDRIARLENAARLTLDAMEADPCDCMAHRLPPPTLRAALEAQGEP